MIRIPLIHKTIEARPEPQPNKELQALNESIKAMSETPEWQAYLLGLKEKENRKKKRPKSGKNNI